MQTIPPQDSPPHRTPCPVCAADPGQRARYAASHNKVQYTLNHCGSCGLEFWSPLTVDTSIYEDEGFAAYVDYHAGRRPFPRWAEPLFASLQTPPVRSLDIGCGDGAVMARLQALGVDVRGIDLDPQSVSIAERRCGVGSCTVSTLDAYVAARDGDAPPFELVTFFEVLEHQVDPMGFLAQVAKLAAPDALVAGSVPNRDRFLAKADRRVDTGDLPPHHFLWFSPGALRSLLERAGFRDIRIQRTGAISLPETFRKTRRLIERRTHATAGLPRGLAATTAWLLAPAPTLAIWAGRALRPSHLFFSCRT